LKKKKVLQDLKFVAIDYYVKIWSMIFLKNRSPYSA
jgi:hypothetical protein